jgi:phosphoglycolate phosphatase
MRASGLLLGIATGKSLRALAALLEQHGLSDWFVTLQTADLVPGKPNPDMVLRAQEEIGSAAAETVVVGDSVFDIEMACRAGVGALGVAWGYHAPEALRAAGALGIAGCREELPGLVLAVLDRP